MVSSAHIGIFRDLLGMSKKQEECLSDGKLDEAVEILKEREVLIEKLKSDGVSLNAEDSVAKELIKEITESDERLTLLITERRNSTSESLKRRLEAKKVLDAYSGTMG